VGSAGVALVPFAIDWQAAPVPSLPAGPPILDSLSDVCDWLGTYRERLRVARDDEREQIGVLIGRMSARYHLRRAELA
jgi:hypothetical protein